MLDFHHQATPATIAEKVDHSLRTRRFNAEIFSDSNLQSCAKTEVKDRQVHTFRVSEMD